MIKEPINQKNLLSALRQHQMEMGEYEPTTVFDLMSLCPFRTRLARASDTIEVPVKVKAMRVEEGVLIRESSIIGFDDRRPIYKEYVVHDLNALSIKVNPGHFQDALLTKRMTGLLISDRLLEEVLAPLDAVLVVGTQEGVKGVSLGNFVSTELHVVKNVSRQARMRF